MKKYLPLLQIIKDNLEELSALITLKHNVKIALDDRNNYLWVLPIEGKIKDRQIITNSYYYIIKNDNTIVSKYTTFERRMIINTISEFYEIKQRIIKINNILQ
jgi:hypothetical protein